MVTEPHEGSDHYGYLSDVSPRDKPWDTHKGASDRVRDLYRGTEQDRLAGRIADCSGLLEFGWIADSDTGEVRLKLRAARFCRVRHCPVCQWRRSLMWVARFLKALPAITADYPTARYLFLTLTVKNCPLEELRSTLAHMNDSWKRLSHRKQFPAIGFARSTEVTRKADDDTAHPHFHVLMMVPETYFKRGYLSHAAWVEMWQSSLRAGYAPTVRVQAVKYNPSRRPNRAVSESPTAALELAILETFKYSVKPSDLVDREWLLKLTQQLHKTRAVALGGVFRNYLSESEPDDLIGEQDTDENLDDITLRFGWREMVKRYIKQ